MQGRERAALEQELGQALEHSMLAGPSGKGGHLIPWARSVELIQEKIYAWQTCMLRRTCSWHAA